VSGSLTAMLHTRRTNIADSPVQDNHMFNKRAAAMQQMHHHSMSSILPASEMLRRASQVRKIYEGIVVIVLLLLFGLCLPPAQPEASLAKSGARPNIILILTDDQRTGDLAHMPNVQKLLVEQGTTFKRFIISQPRCCPSRASFLTGRYSHNHRTGFGGKASAKFFARSGAQSDTYATRLDKAGYRTGYFGKYMNGYAQQRGTPAGWDEFYANVGRNSWSRCFNADGHGMKCQKHGNMDAFFGGRAAGFVKGSGPFLAVYAPNAPHQEGNGPPPVPKGAMKRVKNAALPRPPSFNERNVSDKPGFIKKSRRLGGREIRTMAREHRARLGSLQVVDNFVGKMVSNLKKSGKLENTYFMFTTDNGYHLGQHRMEAGKNTPYVEDVIFPLVVRGPGVPKDATREKLVQNIDLASTFADLAGVKPPAKADGASFAPLLRAKDVPWRDAALVEDSGRRGFYGLITERGEAYVEWNGGFKEYYNLNRDPYQLDNAFESKSVPPPDPARVRELEAQLKRLRSCSANTCRVAAKGVTP
jgi:N-acetylglucosamine-6-sulfatase